MGFAKLDEMPELQIANGILARAVDVFHPVREDFSGTTFEGYPEKSKS